MVNSSESKVSRRDAILTSGKVAVALGAVTLLGGQLPRVRPLTAGEPEEQASRTPPTELPAQTPIGRTDERSGRIAAGSTDGGDQRPAGDHGRRMPRSMSVPGEGVEPSRPCGHRILSPARLPVPPSRHVRPRPRPDRRVYRLVGASPSHPSRRRRRSRITRRRLSWDWAGSEAS